LAGADGGFSLDDAGGLAGADGGFLLDDAGGLAGADGGFLLDDSGGLAGADELVSNKKILKDILPFFKRYLANRLFQVPTVLLLRPYLSPQLVMNESEKESVLPFHQELSFRKIMAIFVCCALKRKHLATKIYSLVFV